jgi:hypothetical protein
MPGKYFEEFAIGEVLQHRPGHTITAMNNRGEMVACCRRAALMKEQA